ncbi:glycerol-3-phosphate responsive antiterminator [Falsibacillus albus]|uniref:Glycerol uptake operon antiterminator regulatory protein n=1 Tax=Falsibacillus albus TaxID=2478915 RepID=A0A3L7JUR8_9BACI|nr:glycerol-3-phosphate responsive antiterminator [Falsibacillus albus]RLQ94035.1 glycerol-3-phosphate responsive antiterminator [Falsibacillus albus]
MGVKEDLLKVLKWEQLIVSIKNPKTLDQFLESDISTAFLLMGNINNLQGYVQEMKRRNKFVFLHLDMVQGIRNDLEGLKFLSHYIKPHGIITTKKQLIISAKNLGFLTVQRLFLVDSDAVRNGLEITREYQPDFIEAMPGIIPSMCQAIAEKVDQVFITGGLIQNQEQIQTALDHGAFAVSTSNLKLCKDILSKKRGCEET